MLILMLSLPPFYAHGTIYSASDANGSVSAAGYCPTANFTPAGIPWKISANLSATGLSTYCRTASVSAGGTSSAEVAIGGDGGLTSTTQNYGFIIGEGGAAAEFNITSFRIWLPSQQTLSIESYKDNSLVSSSSTALLPVNFSTISLNLTDVDQVLIRHNDVDSYATSFDMSAFVDSTPPSFENGTPSTSSVTANSLTLNIDLDEDGTVYYVMLSDGAAAPSVSEIMTGSGASGAAAVSAANGATTGTLKSFNITGLADSTAYDIYVVAEDNAPSPNLQNSATKVDVTTADGTAPSITSIARQSPSVSPTSADSVTWRMTFSEDVQNVDASDFKLTGSSASLAVSQVSANVYDISASGGDLADLNASITLSVETTSNGQNIQDLSANALGNVSDSGAYQISNDVAAPSMVISAAQGASGFSSDDTYLALTFTASEEVGASPNDFVVADVNVSNGSLSSFTKVSATVYTATLSPTKPGTVSVNVPAGAFKDSAGNANASASQFDWTYGLDPTTKADVSETIKATTKGVRSLSSISKSNILHRVNWLNRNRFSANKSHQGIQFQFAHNLLNGLLNGTHNLPVSLEQSMHDIASLKDIGAVIDYGEHQGTNMAAAKLRQITGLSSLTLNPSGGPISGDWSIWTEGEITIGKNDAKEQDSESVAISIGMDKYLNDNDTDLLGFAVTLGQDDIKHGTSGSKTSADNYSLALYSVIDSDTASQLELLLGIGHMTFNSKRIDGAQTLTGKRASDLIFGTVGTRFNIVNNKQFSLSPYAKIDSTYGVLYAYDESGGSLAIAYDRQYVNQAMISLGGDVALNYYLNNRQLKPYGKLEVGYDLSGSSTTNMHYLDNSATRYSFETLSVSKGLWKLGIGAEYIISKYVTASFGFEHTNYFGKAYSNGVRAALSAKY